MERAAEGKTKVWAAAAVHRAIFLTTSRKTLTVSYVILLRAIGRYWPKKRILPSKP